MTRAKANRYIKQRATSQGFYEQVRERHPHLSSRRAYKQWLKENHESAAEAYLANYASIVPQGAKFLQSLADTNLRFGCFSLPRDEGTDPSTEILMWSHYANKHEGVRITFDINASERSIYYLNPIRYSSSPVDIDLTLGLNTSQVQTGLNKALSTKALAWAYEREVRLFTTPGRCHTITGDDGVVRSFFPFPQSWVIGVDFGLCCPEAEVLRISALARISQGSRREAPPDGIACKAREGFQDERYADIP